MSHHASLAPSSMPAIMECACFQSRGDDDEADDSADMGTEIHRVLACIAKGQDFTDTYLDFDTLDKCIEVYKTAIAFIEDNCEYDELEVEERVELFDDEQNRVTFGARDIGCHGKEKLGEEKIVVVLDWKGCFDYKPHDKDYKEQLHTYALCDMRKYNCNKALCIEVYVMPTKLKPYWVTYNEAAATVECCIARRNDPNKKPQVSYYCKWCSKILTCPAINTRISRIAKVFNDLPDADKIRNPEDITDPVEMSTVLSFAKFTAKQYANLIIKICKRIEDAALALSDQNIEIPFYARRIETGDKEITDIGEAFLLSELDNTEFYSTLTCSIPKLAEVHAIKTGKSKNKARSEIESMLAQVIKCKPAKTVLDHIKVEYPAYSIHNAEVNEVSNSQLVSQD